MTLGKQVVILERRENRGSWMYREEEMRKEAGNRRGTGE